MNSAQNSPMLCVDIGGSRIKAGVLSAAMSLEDLQKVSTVAFDSKEWLDESLPLLFCKNTEGSLRQRISAPFTRICIGIHGPVREGKLYITAKSDSPKELRRSFEEVAKCPVFMECDAGIWAHGVIRWQNLTHQTISYPCLSVTLGTGIGIAVLHSSQEVVNVELTALDVPLNRLHEIARCQPMNVEYLQSTPHDFVGKAFFDWVRQECAYYDEYLLQKEFTWRVIALLEDLEEYFADALGIQIQSIAVSGGNSRWLMHEALKNALKFPLLLITPQNISRFGVSPDIISLLGSSLLPTSSHVGIIPSWEKVLRQYTVSS